MSSSWRLWCGLVSGPLEVGAIVLRKHTVDLNQFYWMSRHFVWLIPLTDLLIFLALGLVAGAGGPGLASPGKLALRGCSARLTLLPLFWAAFPRIYGLAGFILALGVAARLVPVLERHAAGFRRCVALSFPVLAGLMPLLAASVWTGDRLKEWREEARPLPAPGSPNVLLIVLDTVAADHLSLHGYDRPTSPTLDGLARRGIRFDRAQATSSWTLPSHASFFTGRWPHELSAGWLTPLDATHPTLAEYLGSRGYATAGFVANLFYCGADTGLDRGFTALPGLHLPGLSAFKLAALVDRPVEGLRAIHRVPEGARVNLDFFPRVAPDVRRRESQAGDGGQSRIPRLAVEPPAAGAAVLRLPELTTMSTIRTSSRRAASIDSAVKPRTEREMDLIENWRTRGQARALRPGGRVRPRLLRRLHRGPRRATGPADRRAGATRHPRADLADRHLGPRRELRRAARRLRPRDQPLSASAPRPAGDRPAGRGGPGREPRPRVVPETVSLRDLPATVVDLLDLEAGAPFPGASLARLWGRPESGDSADPAASGPSPALSEVVPTNTLDPDSGEPARRSTRVGVAGRRGFDLHPDPVPR